MIGKLYFLVKGNNSHMLSFPLPLKSRLHLFQASAEPEPAAEEPKAEEPTAEEEPAKVDIDLNDPEVQAAAVKIQASVKGYLTRKEMNKGKEDDGGDQPQE